MARRRTADWSRDKYRYRQFIADVNGLAAHEGNPAKPLTMREVDGWGLAIFFAWQSEVCRRRLAAGLPEHAEVKDT